MSDTPRRPRQVLVGEHDYARAPRFTWPGEVVLAAGDAQRVVPGTWHLEFAPRALVRAGVAAAVPGVDDADAWAERLVKVVTLHEPGLQLRIGAMADGAWQTLEVTVPSRPPTRVEFDRTALAQLGGCTSAVLRVLA